MTERSAAGFVRTALKFQNDGVTGVLHVHAEGVTTAIYFRRGEACFAAGGSVSDSLGRILVEEGVLSDAAYAEAMAVMADQSESRDLRLGDVLVRLGCMTLDGVQAALERQVRRKIVRCMQWDSMTLAFAPGTPQEALGYYPSPFEPLIFEAAQRYFDAARVQELLRSWLPVYVALREPAAALAGRYGMPRRDAALLSAIDGTRTMTQLLASDAAMLPVATALFLGDALEPLRHPRATADPPPPARPPAQARPQPRIPAAPTPRRRQHITARDRDEPREPISRRGRHSGRGELPRRQRPSWHSDPEAFEPAAEPRRTPREPLPRRGTRSTGNPFEARRERPTWRAEDLPRRSGTGTHRALTAHEVHEPQPSVQPPSGRRARVEAEQAFQRGMRALHAQRWDDAMGYLGHAAAMVPDALEYPLAALWTRYCRLRDERERARLVPELSQLAKRAAIQDRSLAFPPYVLAHMALLEGDEARALRLFEVAAYRDPDNLDAERHVRLLSKRR